MSGAAHCPIPWSAELLALSQRHGARLAVRDGEQALDYAALCRQAHALAAWLGQAVAGQPAPRAPVPSPPESGQPAPSLLDTPVPPEPSLPKPGRSTPGVTASGLRIGVLLHNGCRAVLADYGVAVAGGCIVHLNPAYGEDELRGCLRRAPVDAVLTEAALAPRLAGLDLPVLVIEQVPLADAPPVRVALAPADAAAPGRILFTSGSSGPPKAVVYSHYKRWLAATVLRSVLPYRPEGSGLLLMTPYVHGASMLARAWLDCGGWVQLHAGVQSGLVREALADDGLQAMFAPPSVLAKLCTELAGLRRPLRCLFSGTQPLPPALYCRALPIFGPVVRITYGKSENLNPITVLDPAECDAVYGAPCGETPGGDAAGAERPAACIPGSAASADVAYAAGTSGCCVGRPGPGVDLMLAPDGEVLLRSQHMFDGYLTEQGWQPHAPDAWHATGDTGRWDAAGRLWLTGRTNQIVNSGGYKINPDEVADAVRAVAGVSDALVVGIASDYWTEVLVCAYVASDPALDVVTLRQALAGLTAYKQPRLYVALDALPQTPMGKPSPQGLRAHIARHYTLTDGPRPQLSPRPSG